MRKIILGLAMTAVAGAAYAGPKTVPAAAIEGPETIAYGSLTPGPMAAFSPAKLGVLGALGGAVGGGIAGMVAMSDGKKIVADNDLPDPAQPMARNLAYDLADLRGAEVDDRPLDLQRMKTREIAVAGGQARYVVGTITASRSFIWQSLAWNRYRVHYSAVLNVIDTQTREIALAEGCNWNSDKHGAPTPDGAPTRASLLDDKAARLKAIFDEAGQACYAQFSATLRKWAPPQAVRPQSYASRAVEVAPAPLPAPMPVRQAELRPVEPVRVAYSVPALVAPPPPPPPVRIVEVAPPEPMPPEPMPQELAPPEPVAPAVVLAKVEPPRYPAPVFDARLAAAYAEPVPLPGFVVRR